MEKEKKDLTFEESQELEISLYNQMKRLQSVDRESADVVYKNLEAAIRNLSTYKLEVMGLNSIKYKENE